MHLDIEFKYNTNRQTNSTEFKICKAGKKAQQIINNCIIKIHFLNMITKQMLKNKTSVAYFSHINCMNIWKFIKFRRLNKNNVSEQLSTLEIT